MNKILVIGASGHAKVVTEAIELNADYEVYGFIDSYKPCGRKELGYEILGTEDIISDLARKGINKGVIAIGDNWSRYLMYSKIKEMAPDFEFITVIHPSAIISPNASIGLGTVVLASVTINTHAKVGNFCIVNTNSNLGHDSAMKDFSSLAPGVTVGGNVNIGECTAISLGVNIIQNIDIGEHSVIGAGSLIVQNIKDFMLVYGVPGREIRTIKKGENYLIKR